MECRENRLNLDDYKSLRESVGWKNFSKEQAATAISNSTYVVTVINDDKAIAMGRLIGDGLYYLIVDVVVKPEFQGNGIGSRIIDMLLKYVDDKLQEGGRASVQLISEKGKDYC